MKIGHVLSLYVSQNHLAVLTFCRCFVVVEKTITESKDNNDRAVAAAIEIQRQWRGHNARY